MRTGVCVHSKEIQNDESAVHEASHHVHPQVRGVDHHDHAGGLGKRKARAVPTPIAAAIYPVGDVAAGKPFKGWTFQSLVEGRAARWYGAPVMVFNTPMAAAEAAARLRGWFLGTFDSAEIPLPSGDPDEYMPF
jgi:hypothetical protein